MAECPISVGRLYRSRNGSPGSVLPEQWEGDKEIAIEYLLRLDPENGWIEADKEVRDRLRDNWPLVEALASALVEQKTLTGREARDLMTRMNPTFRTLTS